MKIKIINNYTKNYIIYKVDFEKHTLEMIDKNGIEFNKDTILNMIFSDKNYNDFISWIRSRVGGKSIGECIKIARHNKLKSIKDDILVEVMN